jgi:small subunit ribosomal protein S1
LSIKQLLPDPWEGIETKYPVEAKKTGEVVRLAPFGAFVVFEPGIEGLVHISKLPAEKTLAVGDQINCYIESIDVPHRRMSLGLVVTEKPVGYK